jgi:hypothetical protein
LFLLFPEKLLQAACHMALFLATLAWRTNMIRQKHIPGGS